MEFGYFTLSDNHYDNNPRTANEFVANILAEAIHAEAIGLHSAWIGEHHFSSLGVLSCPDLSLAYVAARTKKIRLAPAVTVLPLHHPIRFAEQWASLDLLSGGRVDWAAGRGYDAREYAPFNVSFAENQAIFNEGMEVVRRLWAGEGPVTVAEQDGVDVEPVLVDEVQCREGGCEGGTAHDQRSTVSLRERADLRSVDLAQDGRVPAGLLQRS